jgi:hypothetical protein
MSILAKEIQQLNLKLEGPVTTTEDMEESTFTGRFFISLFARLTQWFADTTNGITDFFAKIGHFDEVCAKNSDGTETCVDGDQLKSLLGASVAGAPSSGVPPEAPAASPVPEGTDADAGTTTASNVAEPQPTSETPADVADQEPDAVVEEPEPGDEPAPAPPAELDAANDNQPAEPLPASGTE